MGGREASPRREGSSSGSTEPYYCSETARREVVEHARGLLDPELARTYAAADIAQKALLAAFEARKRLPSDRAKVVAWLKNTVTNEVNNLRRQAASKQRWSKRRRINLEEYRYRIRMAVSSSDDFVHRVETVDLLEMALSGFSESERALVLGVFHNHSLDRLARECGITISGVRKRLSVLLRRAAENLARRESSRRRRRRLRREP